MSEFHRMITYLYLYEQGMKSRNIGFAKVEQRREQCLLEIHMKNTGCSLTPVPVYFYVRKDTQLAGIPLGNFSLIRGSGDFRIILKAENLNDSGYKLEDVKGIYIPLNEQTMLVSQWDDDEFHREDFSDITETQDSSDKISQSLKVAENLTPAQENTTPDTESESASAVPAQEEIGPNPAPEDVSPQQTDAAVIQQNAETPPEKSTDALKALEALPRPSNQNKGFHTVSQRETQTSRQNPKLTNLPGTEQSSENSHADAPENWSLRWRFILENYPVMTPFAGDGHTLCVRMELKDLRQLPKQFWYLGNNSFLLHGFFNYRYFILGMTEEFGVKKWFIGVPGVFQNPERVMAALFGFPEFRSERQSSINTGEFGYWYRYLNELFEPAAKDHS